MLKVRRLHHDGGNVKEFFELEDSKMKELSQSWKQENVTLPEDMLIQVGNYEVDYAELNIESNNSRFIMARNFKENDGKSTEKETIHKSLFRPFMKKPVPVPLKIFISYAHKNFGYLERLEVHLSGLKRLGKIEDWNDRKIQIGDEWDAKIKTKLRESDLVILLVSADFINSAYIQETEVEIIEAKEKSKIMPIVVEDCLWEDQTYLSDVMVYPGAVLNSEEKRESITVLPLANQPSKETGL